VHYLKLVSGFLLFHRQSRIAVSGEEGESTLTRMSACLSFRWRNSEFVVPIKYPFVPSCSNMSICCNGVYGPKNIP